MRYELTDYERAAIKPMLPCGRSTCPQRNLGMTAQVSVGRYACVSGFAALGDDLGHQSNAFAYGLGGGPSRAY